MTLSTDAPARKPRAGAIAALLALPLLYLAAMWVLRADTVPYWLWHNADPTYPYLLNALNLLNLDGPGHIDHPGTPIQALGALLFRLMYPASAVSDITAAVLADPEAHALAFNTLILIFVAACLAVLGRVALGTFGSLPAALAAQSSPFLSMLILRHSTQIRPEPMLVAATCLLAAVTLHAARRGTTERPVAYALAFGAAIGFGTAVKITFAPLGLLPLLLLARPRVIALYVAACALSFLVFTIPAWGAWDLFFEWVHKVAMGSGAYGGGAATIIDAETYPKNVRKLFSRPLFLAFFLLGLMTLAAYRRARRRGNVPATPMTAALGGILLAQLAEVLVVAKHPSAHYIIPAFILTGPSAALTMVLAARLPIFAARRLAYGRAWLVLLAGLAVSQSIAFRTLDREAIAARDSATRLDMSRFKACAKVYYDVASAQTYAFQMADLYARQRHGEWLAATQPADEYSAILWRDNTVLRFGPPLDLAAVLAGQSCTVLRGTDEGRMMTALQAAMPGVAATDRCAAGKEAIVTFGIDCGGRSAAAVSTRRDQPAPPRSAAPADPG